MAVILGIDAAWSAAYESGVALVSGAPGRWRFVRSAPGFGKFLDDAELPGAGDASTGVAGCLAALLNASEALSGAPVDVVAVGMPLGERVRASREADRATTAMWPGYARPTESDSDQLRCRGIYAI